MTCENLGGDEPGSALCIVCLAYLIFSHPQIINISYVGQVKGFIQLQICFHGN